MSFAVSETLNGKLIEVKVTGKLTKEAYQEFVPLTESAIKQHGKVRVLVVLDDFHGWTAGALWEDIKFDIKHFKDIERLAIVGDSKWEAGMAKFCHPFTTATIKYFDKKDLVSAQTWIQA